MAEAVADAVAEGVAAEGVAEAVGSTLAEAFSGFATVATALTLIPGGFATVALALASAVAPAVKGSASTAPALKSRAFGLKGSATVKGLVLAHGEGPSAEG